MKTYQKVLKGWRNWASLEHNAKWVKLLEGTPIQNDLSVHIAREINAPEETTFQERVIKERDELSPRVKALDEFIKNNETFTSLSQKEKTLLWNQRYYMTAYLGILNTRIAGFEPDAIADDPSMKVIPE
jgi:hypothetical protein